jgi:hypothetical protein
MADKFTEVRIVDNYYQTSSFFPMPVVLVSTLAASGHCVFPIISPEEKIMP